MRAIELAKTDTFDERAQLLNVVKAAPASGYSIEEMRAALRVLDALAGEGALKLENAEHAFLVGVLKAQKWLIALPEIVAMHDKIVNAPEAS